MGQRLDLQVASDFAGQLQCNLSGHSRTFWIDPVEDKRSSPVVAVLLHNDQETPVYSEKPLEVVLTKALKEGFEKCGLKTATHRQAADIWVLPRLEKFSGASKKGWIKGEAKSEATLTLQFVAHKKGTDFSETVSVGEEQKKGISKNPKKLEKMLNVLLTRLASQVFESSTPNTWLAEQ